MTKNVLIVDDSATMRKIIMRGIRQAGIDNAEFKEAGDGVEGLAAVDGAQFDLRMAEPFDGLRRFVDGFDLDAMSDLEHQHTPYVVVLTQLIARWKAEHGGALPRTFDEKEAFKARSRERASARARASAKTRAQTNAETAPARLLRV